MLTQHEPNVSLPFWDTILDEKLAQPKDSVLFTDHLLGPSRGALTSGPFAGHTNPGGFCELVFGNVTRRFVKEFPDRLSGMLSRDIVQESVFRYATYTDFQAPVPSKLKNDFSSLIETYHSAFHNFIGGDIASVPCAPVDPLFWMWHASLDALWEEFRQEKQTTDIQTEYPDYPALPAGYAAHTPMIPFKESNLWGLSSHFTTYRYKYDVRPSKYSCTLSEDCRSEFLFCHCGQCTSKVQENGNCTGLGDESCFCAGEKRGSCVDNKCNC